MIIVNIFVVCLLFQTYLCDDPVIKTKTGDVRGLEKISGLSGTTIYTFQGIPFAKPPVGNLRFEPPQPTSWDGILNATSEQSPCIQTYDNATVNSEDCLYLNVYTPSLDDKLPVMVYIYGGGYTVGSSLSVLYGPEYFLNQSVIFITINYRLGIFGFITTGDLVAPGNGGLKDQAAALKWIKENISKFGGDPSRITIFGSSAGAMSVSHLMQSPLSKDLFSGAIMQSGTSLSMWALSDETSTYTKDVAKQLNVNTTTSQSLVNGLKSIDADTLQQIGWNTWEQYFEVNALNDRVIAPVVEPKHKGAFLTSTPYENLKRGRFNRVPSIIGFNSNEGASLPLTLEFRETISKFDENPEMLVPASMHVTNSLVRNILGKVIKAEYFGNKTMESQPDEAEILFGDTIFIRPALETVTLQSLYAPTYLYEFTYRGGPGYFVTGRGTNYTGVGHMEELAYMFWTSWGSPAPSPDLTTKQRLVTMWTNFAKYRKPTPTSEDLLENVRWPISNGFTHTYLDIGANLTVKNLPHKKNVAFWDMLFNIFAKPKTTY